MLNQNLPLSELQNELKDDLNRISIIFTALDVEKKTTIINDKKLLGKLHHALNVDKYGNSNFRLNLLLRASKNNLDRFLQKVGIENEQNLGTVKKASRLIWGDNVETRAFIDIFGYDTNLIPITSRGKPNTEKIVASIKPLKSLKDYQSQIFFECMKTIQNNWIRFIVKMPTGAGKTRTMMEVICHFINERLNKERSLIVWIADREELCEQAINAMQEVWSHVGKSDLNIYRLWGNTHIDVFEESGFIVATYQKLNSLIKKGKQFPQPHLVVTDEAHNVLAPTHQTILEKLSSKRTRIIGLTATPIRGLDNIENRQLQEYFNEEIIEINSGDQNAIEYLQGRGYLSHYEPISIPSNITYRLTLEQKRQLEKERDLPQGLLDEISMDDKRNIIIAKELQKLGMKNKQVLYFAPSVKQSKFMNAILLAMGFSSAHIDGHTPTEYRKDVVEKFRNKKINFIFNYNVFSVGFDAPNIEAVFIARPTNSIILHQQMIGRGMRGPKMGGTESFQLYRIVDDLPDIELADEYFSDIWKYNVEN